MKKIVDDQVDDNQIITRLEVDGAEITANIIQGDQKHVTPINPFEYSVRTVDDALHLPALPRSVGLESVYVAGAIHNQLKKSMDVLRSLTEAGRMESSFALFQVMERFYVPIAPDCYALIRKQIERALVEVAQFNDAIMRETLNPGSVPDHELYIPTVETMNTVLNYYTETDRLPQAFRLFLTMRILDVKPNQHTYRSLINASMRYEDIELALLAFENMRNDGIILEEQTYERLFESCCNTVHIDGAVELYHEMLKNFSIPTINKFAYLTTLGVTGLMSWVRMPKSSRSGRGWVTSLQVSPSRYIFPPKHENHKLLEPFIPIEIQNKLIGRQQTSGGGGDGDDNRPSGLLPFA
ncbi:hypothetical protein SAMD00019534_120540 [Acytostelium subglobosum LB1]|uniref:hypothetical protein n=1 Tax=Acytostelium subglobosum LB1 TaxID=1410327 RepID=UPI0006449803|nr:hypothetical protein SAMD00019534_120540 [Acytostelium subglobosum LB1]GAM28878.1 hypothetical protein SAMD00019534_120540 [Acytostelium subglobosum LB1]|eukprot:XP_012748250.1 hypothetical protein SAMD00019534_120540 [Acytostelium subglobosum LB1]